MAIIEISKESVEFVLAHGKKFNTMQRLIFSILILVFRVISSQSLLHFIYGDISPLRIILKKEHDFQFWKVEGLPSILFFLFFWWFTSEYIPKIIKRIILKSYKTGKLHRAIVNPSPEKALHYEALIRKLFRTSLSNAFDRGLKPLTLEEGNLGFDKDTINLSLFNRIKDPYFEIPTLIFGLICFFEVNLLFWAIIIFGISYYFFYASLSGAIIAFQVHKNRIPEIAREEYRALIS